MALAIVTAIIGAAMCGLYLALGYVSGKIAAQEELKGLTLDLPLAIDHGDNGLANPNQNVNASERKESVG